MVHFTKDAAGTIIFSYTTILSLVIEKITCYREHRRILVALFMGNFQNCLKFDETDLVFAITSIF